MKRIVIINGDSFIRAWNTKSEIQGLFRYAGKQLGSRLLAVVRESVVISVEKRVRFQDEFHGSKVARQCPLAQ